MALIFAAHKMYVRTSSRVKLTLTNLHLQDLLREKQNHVEQLILERDLTRQQTENDTMMFQKNINQVSI